MRIYILFLICVYSSFCHSQTSDFKKPDYNRIEKEIRDSTSGFFYADLLRRYNNGDSTMSIDEKRHLYYGFTFQPSYSPYGHSIYADSVQSLLKMPEQSELDLLNIIRFGDSVLVENLLDLRAIDAQLYALDKYGKVHEFNKKMTQMNIIIDALMSSGDGKSKKSAFYVIFISHEYFLLNILGFTFGGKQSLIDHYDYLEVTRNSFGLKGLYFDVTPSLNSMFKE